MVGDISLLEDDNAVVCGHIEILDLANVTSAHFFQLEPVLMKKLTIIGQEATPLRHKGFHIINAPQGTDTIFNMIKSFMSEKNRQRVSQIIFFNFDFYSKKNFGYSFSFLFFQLFVHNKNLESFYEHVPKNILPVEYGGENGTIQEIIDYWEKKLLSYRDYFNEDKNYGVDESLRIGAPFNQETLFGTDGSFRKLEVD